MEKNKKQRNISRVQQFLHKRMSVAEVYNIYIYDKDRVGCLKPKHKEKYEIKLCLNK